METYKLIFVEELGQSYFQCEKEVRQCDFARFAHEFRAGSVLLYPEHRIDKIPSRISYGSPVKKTIISCN